MTVADCWRERPANSVRNAPGSTTVTLMPSGASSLRREPDGGAVAVAGVVHQDVDGAEALLAEPDLLGHLTAVGHVARHTARRQRSGRVCCTG
jgi:hypothetical protein